MLKHKLRCKNLEWHRERFGKTDGCSCCASLQSTNWFYLHLRGCDGVWRVGDDCGIFLEFVVLPLTFRQLENKKCVEQ